jgi:hypothetical protein
MSFPRRAFALLAAQLVAACGLFQHLQVESLGDSAQKPSNVAVYLSVSNGDQPLTELEEQNFRIYENEQLIADSETQQTLLDRQLVAHHRTLLLVDMSAAKDENARRQIGRGVAGFVSAVRRTQGVSVYAFDGRAAPEHIGDYPKGEAGSEEIAQLTNFKSTDPSRNLHGAVLAAVKELGARLMTEQKPIRVGTLVVLSSGPDLAGRATTEQMQQALEASHYQLVAIGVGTDGSYDLEGLDKNGALWTPSLGAVGPTLEDAATRVQNLMDRHYLLSYCSPARAGHRMVRIEVVTDTTDGKELKGDVSFEIDANGFDSGCDPNKTPRFTATGSAKVEPTPAGETSKPAASSGGEKPKGSSETPKEGSDGIVPPPEKPGYAPLPEKK